MLRYFLMLPLACCSPQAADNRDGEQNASDVFRQSAQLMRRAPPEAFITPQDQERARRDDPHDIPCTTVRVYKGIRFIEGRETDACYRMLPRQRYRGVWVNAFEGSRFYPDRSSISSARDEARIWLDVERVRLREMEPDGQTYAVEFEGRRTMFPGPFGHMGGSDHELIVDEVISAVPLQGRQGR